MANSIYNGNLFPTGIPLSRYTAAITNAVATAPGLSSQWVIAELSDVRLAGGHCYMELIEKNQEGQTIAKLRATIWRSYYISLRQKFFQATNREISNGIKALVRGSATHHSIYGLSFNITDIDPSYTMGDMERIRQQIILQLQKEGVVFKNKEKLMPIAPQRIAVISAQGAAGYGDFINHLNGNSEGFVFYPGLFSCVMQGDKVSESIRGALQFIESTADMWDCIAIVRGGGATTDLNGFDDYELAKAVATCGLPVVVGIGHERDRNVLDEIAHTSLKTPTAVAGFFIDRLREAYDKVMGVTDKLRVFSTELIRGEERRVSTVEGLIPQLALRRLADANLKLRSYSDRLPLLTSGRVSKERIKIDGLIKMMQNLSGQKIENQNIKVQNLLKFLDKSAKDITGRQEMRIEKLEALIKVLDPKNTLKRGYSVTRINGKAIKSVKEISDGQILITSFADGDIKSEVLV